LQALPIYLDKIFHPLVAVLLSVTFVLTFGEVQCIFYGLIMLQLANYYSLSRE